MPEYQEKSIVTVSEAFTGDLFRLTVHAPRIAGAAKPGQFVMVRVRETFDPLLRRPLSVHRVSSSDGTIGLLFKVIGKGTRILSGLKPGMEIDLIGPLGKGFQLVPEDSVCMVGGGVGIAPLLFLAQSLIESGSAPAESHVLLGARNRAELEKPAGEFVELGYPVNTATDDGSLGHHGFVTDLLDEVVSKVKQVYVCGPFPMMRIAALKCRDAGVPCQVSLESNMACGLRACLGCAVRAENGEYMHVCANGPVFSADEVSWTL